MTVRVDDVGDKQKDDIVMAMHPTVITKQNTSLLMNDKMAKQFHPRTGDLELPPDGSFFRMPMPCHANALPLPPLRIEWNTELTDLPRYHSTTPSTHLSGLVTREDDVSSFQLNI